MEDLEVKLKEKVTIRKWKKRSTISKQSNNSSGGRLTLVQQHGIKYYRLFQLLVLDDKRNHKYKHNQDHVNNYDPILYSLS